MLDLFDDIDYDEDTEDEDTSLWTEEEKVDEEVDFALSMAYDGLHHRPSVEDMEGWSL